DRPFDFAGDGLDRLEIPRRGDGEAGLDHVHAEVLERMRNLQLLGQVHTGAGRLLAVAERGVENDQPLLGHEGTPTNINEQGPGTYRSQGRSTSLRRLGNSAA